jgi:hypothetical protein
MWLHSARFAVGMQHEDMLRVQGLNDFACAAELRDLAAHGFPLLLVPKSEGRAR